CRSRRPGSLDGRHVLAAGRVRLGTERGRGTQWRASHTNRCWTGVGPRLAATPCRADSKTAAVRRHQSCQRDRCGTHSYAYGSHRWTTCRRCEGSTAPRPAYPCGGRRGKVLGVARLLPYFDADWVPRCASINRDAVHKGVRQLLATV